MSNNNTNNQMIKEWVETFVSMVAHNSGIGYADIMATAQEASEILEFNPLEFKQNLAVDVNPSVKRARNEEAPLTSPLTSPPAPPPTPTNPTPTNSAANTAANSAANSTPDSTALRGDAAQKFIDAKVGKGEWKFLDKEVRRKGLQHSKIPIPDGKGIFQFVIAGTDFKSLFSHKEVLKSAGSRTLR